MSLNYLIKSLIGGKLYQFLRARPPGFPVPQAGLKGPVNVEDANAEIEDSAKLNEAARLEGES